MLKNKSSQVFLTNIRQQDNKTIKQSDNQTIRQSDNQTSRQPVPVIPVTKFSKKSELSFPGPDADGRMMDAVEGGCFYHCVMDHVQKNNPVPML